MLDVLEFYTDHQKREYEEYGMLPNASAASSTATATAPPQKEPARFRAGTGLAGAVDRRPFIASQDTGPRSPDSQSMQSHLPSRHPQAHRPAPKPPKPVETTPPPPRERENAGGHNEESIEREGLASDERRPHLAPSKSSPATSTPETHPVGGAAGAVVGPPPVQPLQSVPKNTEPPAGVAAASAALEGKTKGPPPETERRISTLSEPQIMEKLRQVVSQDDPKAIYMTIRKIGQG